MAYFDSKGIAYKDLGTYSRERTDYPIYGKKVAQAVVSGEYEKGIIFCGTGVGISIAANKVQGAGASAAATVIPQSFPACITIPIS